MPGVVTAYQTGVHGSRPANGAGCILYSCTTHSLVYRDDGTSWTTFATLGTSGALIDPMTTRGDIITRGASAAQRLALGAAGKLLSSNGTDAVWGQGPLTTTGDLLIGATGGTPTRLGIGAAGRILSSDGTTASWGNGPMTTQDDLITGGASGVPTRLAKGSDGQVLTVDPTTHHLVWATPTGGSATIEVEGDTGDDPTNIDHVVFVGAGGISVDVSDDTGGQATVTIDGSGVTGGSGGITHSFAGYNTAGGSTENVVGLRQYMKKITLAADSWIGAIGVYCKLNTDSQDSWIVGLLADVAGVPGGILAVNAAGPITGGSLLAESSGSHSDSPTWLSFPLGIWLAAGDYWLAIKETANNAFWTMYYDGSGSDVVIDSGTYFADGRRFTNTVTAKKYSIRADILS